MDSFGSGFYQIGCDSFKIDLPKTRCAMSSPSVNLLYVDSGRGVTAAPDSLAERYRILLT
jgi:hypothetical protein